MDTGALVGIGCLVLMAIMWSRADAETKRGLAWLFLILTVLGVLVFAANPHAFLGK